jgi:DNA-binding NtrC family response regulator
MTPVDTVKDGDTETSSARPRREHLPGLVAVFSAGRPRFALFPLEGRARTLGRDDLVAQSIDDPRVSRRHLVVERIDEGFLFRDLGSTNGSAVDGVPLSGERALPSPRVVRIGGTLLLPVTDLGLHETAGLTVDRGIVTGPLLSALKAHVAELARAGQSLLLTGESGSGKEVAARAYHAAGRNAHGPFVAVNCAAIPRELAERLLFGTLRGAYSGATQDADGYVQAADRGTLFLDEIAELDLGVQAKLLRVLEAREVTPLGATAGQAVDLRLCAATSRDLRAEVAERRFREDLYYRIGRPELRVPPLRERPEEIPWLIDTTLASVTPDRPLVASAGLVEACLLRAWPGNVRELRADIRSAAILAATRGSARVLPEHLDARAGEAIGQDDARTSAERAEPEPEAREIVAALRAERGNVSRAAGRLSITRSKLRRFIEREGVDLEALRREDP